MLINIIWLGIESKFTGEKARDDGSFLFENFVDRGKMSDCFTSPFSCTVGSQVTTKKEGVT
ncbi:hypothetical protein BK127_36600 [Paenibacillus sp. FSL H7-0331]|nr:hypothetical protein BK127_36600 [Paenibacillus sp. FSL H7-0331]